MPFIREKPQRARRRGLLRVCLWWDVKGDLTPLGTAPRAPDSHCQSARKAVPISIRCFCICRAGANERLHCLRSGCQWCCELFLPTLNVAKRENWVGPTWERVRVIQKHLCFYKNWAQTKHFLIKTCFCLTFYVSFWSATHFISQPSCSQSPNCYRIWSS